MVLAFFAVSGSLSPELGHFDFYCSLCYKHIFIKIVMTIEIIKMRYRSCNYNIKSAFSSLVLVSTVDINHGNTKNKNLKPNFLGTFCFSTPQSPAIRSYSKIIFGYN